MTTRHRIECGVTFIAANEGGRSSPLPPGALSGNTYRPHLVIGDMNQRNAAVADGNHLTEEYIGIAFHNGPAVPQVGVEMLAVLTPIYFPHAMYDRLKPGVTFTVREGPKIMPTEQCVACSMMAATNGGAAFVEPLPCWREHVTRLAGDEPTSGPSL